MIDELCRLLALYFTHRLQNAGLGHAAEIVVDRWRPAGCHDIETDGLRKAIGVSESRVDADSRTHALR